MDHLVNMNDPVLEQEAQKLETLLGNSPAIQATKEQIHAAAKSDIASLIIGDTGVGKELVAKLIHLRSSRAPQAFISIDSSTIPEEIAESELFGHEKGAFTGAIKSKEGMIEKAHGGTLFLDEIANLPLQIQKKLLRAIQEQKVRRVGGVEEKDVDIRLISACNMSLSKAIERGDFRKDLFYRINEFPIQVPSLKDRNEDIPGFAQYFLTQLRDELNPNVKKMDREVLQLFKAYHWPGNIRELQNVMKKAILLAQDDSITVNELPEYIVTCERAKESQNPYSIPRNVQKYERELIVKTLQKTNYNKSKATRLLEISRMSLYKKMKEYGIEEEFKK